MFHLGEDRLSHDHAVDVKLAHHHEDGGHHWGDEGRVVHVDVHVGQIEELRERQEHDEEDDAEVEETLGCVAQGGRQHRDLSVKPGHSRDRMDHTRSIAA